MTGGRRRKQAVRIARFGWRFVRDTKYQGHVLDVIQRHSQAGDVYREATETVSASWLAGKRMFLVGGCELTYLKEYFDHLGVVTYHTFDHGRSSEPGAEVSDPNSPLWDFAPDYVVLSQVQLSARPLHKLQWQGPAYGREEQEGHLAFLASNYANAVSGIHERLSVPVVLMTHPLLYRPPLGFAEHLTLRENLSLAELVRRYELAVYEVAKAYDDTYVLDVNFALEGLGKDRAVDPHLELLGEHVTRAGGRAVAERLLSTLHAIDPAAPRVKCAVFDLDDTLWTGVLREVGTEGVIVRKSTLSAARYLANRGILLAVCSKNDPAEAELLPTLLGEKFCQLLSSVQIGWGLKSEALRAIARELNIGVDSLAFFDDNPRERAEVSMNLPEVLVLSDADILAATQMPMFQPLGALTAEAQNRAESYKAQAQRKELESESSVRPREDFLRSLSLRLTLRPVQPGEVGRVQELLQRTNQLNATMRRTSAGDLRSVLAESEKYEARVALLEDNFGDYGLIGAAVIEKSGDCWTLVELAFSCRAMGKDVEQSMLAYLAGAARDDGRSAMAVAFCRTDRNGEMLRILHEVGFTSGDADGHVDADLVLDLSGDRAFPHPSWLEVVTG